MVGRVRLELTTALSTEFTVRGDTNYTVPAHIKPFNIMVVAPRKGLLRIKISIFGQCPFILNSFGVRGGQCSRISRLSVQYANSLHHTNNNESLRFTHNPNSVSNDQETATRPQLAL